MLSVLRVRDLAIIDELEVELGPGLNVITGETGAGKSILIDALSLVLGGRGKAELVRTGAERAEVEALFEVGADEELVQQVRDAGLADASDSEILARRVLSGANRTRGYLNGRLATAAQLSDIVGAMVDISSQHEHHTLVDPNTHLSFLDAFGKLEGTRRELAERVRDLRAADEALERARTESQQKGEREDLLRFQLAEIEELAPEKGELDALNAERARLRHAERLAGAAGGAEEALYASDDAMCAALGRIVTELTEAARIDPELAPMAEAVDSALTQLEDAARELGVYARELNVDPSRLSAVEDRVHRLQRAARKYGGDVDAILDHAAKARAEIDELDRVEERIEELEATRDAALAAAAERARTLSAQRGAIASDLGKRISAELHTLGMGDARIEVRLEPLVERKGELTVGDARLTETGIDRVEFLIAPNRGEDPKPLRKIASGGELSRAMLAVKRVLSGVGRAGLYVFDEVDSGVGGAVAETIGQKLAEVAQHHQVICVTHLAQIAVYGDRHYRVEKAVKDGRTTSRIRALTEKERKEEIARMVGGLEITASTRRTAAEMLASARARA
ncbi:MAG: DNA repair protein RecN [Sandaracinaceae bacterium]